MVTNVASHTRFVQPCLLPAMSFQVTTRVSIINAQITSAVISGRIHLVAPIQQLRAINARIAIVSSRRVILPNAANCAPAHFGTSSLIFNSGGYRM